VWSLGPHPVATPEITRSADARLASSASSYGIGSNLGGTQYGRAGSVASSQDSYLGGISPYVLLMMVHFPRTDDDGNRPAAAYNGIPYQSGYGVNGVNPQSMCNPWVLRPCGPRGTANVENRSHAPTIPGMMDAGPPGYRSRQLSSASSVSSEPIKILETRAKPQCWEHGCNGRQFSTFSNLLRHQREKSGTAAKSYCPRCNAEFTRTTARVRMPFPPPLCPDSGGLTERRTVTCSTKSANPARRRNAETVICPGVASSAVNAFLFLSCDPQ
jgi:hypothetical protein